jgi:hypothetical protein
MEMAESDNDQELMQLIDQQLAAFRQIAQIFQN